MREKAKSGNYTVVWNDINGSLSKFHAYDSCTNSGQRASYIAVGK